MLTAVITIDGKQAGTVVCKNIDGAYNDRAEYEYLYTGDAPPIIKGRVFHHKPNGAIALLKEVCEDIETKGGR